MTDLEDRVDSAASALYDTLISWRRHLHQRPELAFGEFQTASFVLEKLSKLPVRIFEGKDAQDLTAVHLREPEVVERFSRLALEEGVDRGRVERMKQEGTAVVAEIGGGNGPVIGLRVDMDALPIHEAENDHTPAIRGFRSRYEGLMHACGHDGHTAIGLGVLAALSEVHEALPGRLRVFFQPAEEGTMGGAASMVCTPLVETLDAMIPIHIGLGAPSGSVISASSFLATTKYRIRYEGPPGAHVVAEPQTGANAMLAAASTIQMLNALPPHSRGWYNLNVGIFRSGENIGVLPNQAEIQLGFWAESQEAHDFVASEVELIARNMAAAGKCKADIAIIGRAPTAVPDRELAVVLDTIAAEIGLSCLPAEQIKAGEDATEFMAAVQARGGRSTMAVLGSDLAANHHHPRFDFDERVLEDGTRLLARSVLRLMTAV